jgi:hypothetical protein
MINGVFTLDGLDKFFILNHKLNKKAKSLEKNWREGGRKKEVISSKLCTSIITLLAYVA